MTLKFQITAVLVLIISLLTAGLTWQQIRSIRISLGEEIETAGEIATQVLSRVNEIYQDEGSRPMKKFLTRLGRLRAHDIILYDDYGDVLYRSPASEYLVNDRAPTWFENAVSPEDSEREFVLSNARLVVRTDASRAIVEGWLEFRFLLTSIGLGFVLLNLLAYWLVGRAMAPFNRVVTALTAVQSGNYNTHLPELPGAEARAIGVTFNSMVDSVRESIRAREAAAMATAELKKNRELTQEIQRRMEHEHTSLAQELHDELGQHVTAIKTLGVSISNRVNHSMPAVAQTAQLVVESADRIHADMRHMLTRLRPASLDQFGLGDAITDLISDWQLKHPEKQLAMTSNKALDNLPPTVATAAFRITQEAITNAIRHSGAKNIDVTVNWSENTLLLEIRDNGRGLKDTLPKAGFGLTGMQERVSALNGTLHVGQSKAGGVRITATLPLEAMHPTPAKLPAQA